MGRLLKRLDAIGELFGTIAMGVCDVAKSTAHTP